MALLTGWTAREVQALVEAGAVLVDGERGRQEPAARGGERDRGARRARWRRAARSPTRRSPVVVRYEDDDVVVVAKPAGLVVHPAPGTPTARWCNGLLARYPEIADVGDPARPGHRAPARPRHQRPAGGRALGAAPTTRSCAMLAAHDVERRYDALVWGTPESARGVIDAPIGRSVAPPDAHGGARGRRTAAHRATRSSPRTATRRCALLECRLETGRTHQIRVHLRRSAIPSWATPPTAGSAAAMLALDRPFLHAGGLAFAHPVTGERGAVEEPLPGRRPAQTVLSRLAGALERQSSASASAPGAGRGARRRGPGCAAPDRAPVACRATDGGVGLGHAEQAEVGAQAPPGGANAVTLTAPARRQQLASQRSSWYLGRSS